MKKFIYICAFLLVFFPACNSDGNKTPANSDTAKTNKDSASQSKEASEDVIPFPELSRNDSLWQKDCDEMIKKLTALAPLEIKKTGEYEDQFINKKVVWKLNFEKTGKNNAGEKILDFDLEPFGIMYKFFSGKPVMMDFKPAAGTLSAWKNIKSGSQVKVSGIVTAVSFVTMTPGDSPDRHVPAAIVFVEDVIIIKE
jgi:hypothetical protein